MSQVLTFPLNQTQLRVNHRESPLLAALALSKTFFTFSVCPEDPAQSCSLLDQKLNRFSESTRTIRTRARMMNHLECVTPFCCKSLTMQLCTLREHFSGDPESHAFATLRRLWRESFRRVRH